LKAEQQIHRAVVQHLPQRGAKGLVFIHVPNGGYRRPSEAAIFSGLGVRAGVSDLLLWHDGKSYALELKAPRGRASEAQLQFLVDMDRACVPTSLAEGSMRLCVLSSGGNCYAESSQ
jgi:VRR-NUC domain